MTNRVGLRATVRGRVQGVGFRWYAQARAEALGVDGIVRNLRNGDVEVVAEGPRVALEELLEALKEGPSGAGVDEVDVKWEAAAGGAKGFQIGETR